VSTAGKSTRYLAKPDIELISSLGGAVRDGSGGTTAMASNLLG
jgi:hypothetical protein